MTYLLPLQGQLTRVDYTFPNIVDAILVNLMIDATKPKARDAYTEVFTDFSPRGAQQVFAHLNMTAGQLPILFTMNRMK
jgi:hypothetical protein